MSIRTCSTAHDVVPGRRLATIAWIWFTTIFGPFGRFAACRTMRPCLRAARLIQNRHATETIDDAVRSHSAALGTEALGPWFAQRPSLSSSYSVESRRRWLATKGNLREPHP